MSTLIELEYDGTVLKGELLYKDKNYLNIKIVEPYSGLTSKLIRSGPGVMNPNHFLTDYGDREARRLLIDSYKKLKILTNSIDRFARVYKMYQEEIKELNSISNDKIKQRIGSKLKDWLFDCILTPSVTGLVFSIDQEGEVEEILKCELVSNRDMK